MLTFCCCEWLYQENLAGDTPCISALKRKRETLLIGLMFDEVKSLKYIKQLNDLSQNLGEKLDDGVSKSIEKAQKQQQAQQQQNPNNMKIVVVTLKFEMKNYLIQYY